MSHQHSANRATEKADPYPSPLARGGKGGLFNDSASRGHNRTSRPAVRQGARQGIACMGEYAHGLISTGWPKPYHLEALASDSVLPCDKTTAALRLEEDIPSLRRYAWVAAAQLERCG